jgi:anti-anti-sigma regulatory factor
MTTAELPPSVTRVRPVSVRTVSRAFDLPVATDAGSPDTTVLLRAVVDLDLASETAAREQLRACEAAGWTRIIVTIDPDCFVDVRGLNVLLDAARRARGRSREFVVVDRGGLVRKMVTALQLQAELYVADAPTATG